MKSFIQSIDIMKIRHLENINIPLSETEPKHLILTGKNGSGKTSVLEKLRDYIEQNIYHKHLLEIRNFQNAIIEYKTNLEKSEDIITKNHLNQQISYLTNQLNSWCVNNLAISFTNPEEMLQKSQDGDFILGFFTANRTNQMDVPLGPVLFDTPKTYSLNDEAQRKFLQYLVNIRVSKALAVEENSANSHHTSQKIEEWFSKFEKMLQMIFSDKDLKLVFEYGKYNFKIQTNAREELGFNELSSGYAAVINIISNIIMRMTNDKTNVLDVFEREGIILIDEIDVHLHIELQKQILPFLTSFFPNIQFIVTTHSPFVLSSIENAVIYDLENNILVEDLSGYSYSGIVENYFESDKYSNILNDKFFRYKNLKVRFALLTDSEISELKSLEEYLNNVKSELSPELAALMLQLK